MNEQLHLPPPDTGDQPTAADPGLWLWEGKTPAAIWASRASTPTPSPPPHSRMPYLVILALLLIILLSASDSAVSDSAVEAPLSVISAQARLPPLPEPLPEPVSVTSEPLHERAPYPVSAAKPRPRKPVRSPFAIRGVLTPPRLD